MLKKFALIIIVLITISSSISVAQGNDSLDKKQKLYEVNCIKSLEVQYEGIVEHTIYNAIVFKRKYPAYNFENILKSLKNVSQNKMNPIIRYEAQLAILFIENYSLFEEVQISNRFSPELYKEISGKIHNKILALN
ncbi:MAG: hypothetical protein JEY94_05400 [Melioribacteraceae bacterium]|nr:hypothetical protein [Melioribacteraceae bacterium]